MAGSIPEDFIREIVDTTNIVSLVEGYLPLKKKAKTTGGYVLFVMMARTLLLVLVNKNSFIIVLNAEQPEM